MTLSFCNMATKAVARVKDPLDASRLVGRLALDHSDLPWQP